MRIESQSLAARALLTPTPEAAASISLSVQSGVARYAAAPPLPVAAPSSRLSSALFDMQFKEQFSGDGAAADNSGFGRTEREFIDWSKRSLAETIRAQVLEENGLTEESLRRLPQDEQHAILDEIKERIRLAQTSAATPRDNAPDMPPAVPELSLWDHPGFASAA
ncbi:hypothetical protein BJF92_21670 [Rhizobium rhizosphaerae]|uniref:Uncharacterized protein n=1 Tax=Xaviernesmea rhizosphaerae TaxID=1672749 RepID=A0A1Q9AQL8_9HYPH|nr:hypothetical protein [Xaviernesmea rhizosphaerae]OLP57666.1 hypothetical protein BJF92_21670 [Xaviernesmea rhizosphaerae]